MYAIGRKLCQLCRTSLPSCAPSTRTFTPNGKINTEVNLFFNNEVQNILKQLAGFDMGKIFQSRKLGERLKPAKYKFMTSDELDKAMAESKALAEEMMQMPPVIPIRDEIEAVLSEDPELIEYDKSKFVITDISFGKTDRTRTIVVRDPNGNLRKARWSERRNANQTYFPRPGRQFRVPKMFQPEFLKPILGRGDYLFILDRACIEFDPDDEEYHRVTQATYNTIEEKQAYGSLRFTRHFGPMVFFFVLNKTIDNLLLENLKTDRILDAAELIRLYHIVHPSAVSAGAKLQPGQEVAFIKEYIDKDSSIKVALELALMAYDKKAVDLRV